MRTQHEPCQHQLGTPLADKHTACHNPGTHANIVVARASDSVTLSTMNDVINDLASALYKRDGNLILIANNRVYVFRNVREFRANGHLWHNVPHVAFTVRNGVSAHYTTKTNYAKS